MFLLNKIHEVELSYWSLITPTNNMKKFLHLVRVPVIEDNIQMVCCWWESCVDGLAEFMALISHETHQEEKRVQEEGRWAILRPFGSVCWISITLCIPSGGGMLGSNTGMEECVGEITVFYSPPTDPSIPCMDFIAWSRRWIGMFVIQEDVPFSHSNGYNFCREKGGCWK